MLLPGMKINTSPTNYDPIRQMQLATFNGASWELFGELLIGLIDSGRAFPLARGSRASVTPTP